MATSVTSYVDVTDWRNSPNSVLCTEPIANFTRILTSVNNSLFNFPIRVSDNETDVSRMCLYSENMNSEIVLGNNVKNVVSMLEGAKRYNRPLILPNSVEECNSLFRQCFNFNYAVNIPRNVKSCSAMFYYCNNFNSEVRFLGNNVLSVESMFANCSRFNRPLNIPQTVTDCRSVLSGAYMYSYDINLNGDCSGALTDAWRVKNIYFNDVTYAQSAISNNYGGNVYIRNIGTNRDNYSGMFYGGVNSYRNNQSALYIHCNETVASRLRSWTNIFVQDSILTWTAMSGGHLNQRFNIYIYNNYTG